jgi:diguanylate cyclase (GGDEF)-like protein/PAS domain S-box-containing protein
VEEPTFDEHAATVCSVWGEREMAVFDRAVIEHSMNAVIACDEHENLVVFNPTAREWHGLDARQIEPSRWAEHYRLFLPDGVTPFPAEDVPLARAFAGETVRNVAMVIRAEGQPPRHVSCGGSPFFDEDGHQLGAFVVLVDTTERDLAVEALAESEELLARVLAEAPLPVMLHADDDEIIRVNRAWEDSTGYTLLSTPTTAVWAMKAFGSRAADVRRQMGCVYGKDATAYNGEHAIRTSDGDARIWDFSSAPLGRLPDGRRLAITMGRDVTELRRLASELEHLATHDALTGLPNRRLFEAETNRAAAFAARGTISTILFTDVDEFKSCNDIFGHEFGDRVLREIAQAMRGAVRETDTVARIGGDEFGVVLWGQTGDEVEEISRRLSESVAAIGREHGLGIGLSIGAAVLTAETDVSSVLAEADTRMYEAKASE